MGDAAVDATGNMDAGGDGRADGGDRGSGDGRGGGRDGARGDVIPTPPTPPMPASIVRAISAIKATVEAVKKSQKNSHGGYMFASTDDIYAAVARKMGEVGYHIHALEEDCKIVRVEKSTKDGLVTVQWLQVVYSYLHATETDTWQHPKDRRTLYIQITGPQTFQAAQSFAEKSYIRSLLKLPTGDMDLDSMHQADTEEDQNDMLAPRKRKSSSAAKKDGTDVVFNEIRGAISGADGPAELHQIRRDNWSAWEQMPARWRQILDAEFEDRMAEFDVEMQPAE